MLKTHLLVILVLSLSVIGCRSKSSFVKDDATDADRSERIFDSELIISKKFDGPALPVLKLLMGVEKTVLGSDLQTAIAAGKGLGGEFLSFSPIFRKPFNKPVLSPVEEDEAGDKFRTITLFQGTGVGAKIYILYSQFTMRESEYQKDTSDERLIREARNTHWRVATAQSRSLFESGSIPTSSGAFDQRRPLIDKAMHIVDSKYTGPAAISAVIGALDMLNDTARFIPGYAGADELFYGDGQWQRGVGALLLVSDAVPLLGSVRNISRVARAGSQSFIVVGAGTRIVDGIKTSLEGNASLGTGVDISFAVIESALYAISRVRVRVKISATAASNEVSDIIGAVAHNGDLDSYGRILVPDEASARRLAEALSNGRSAADIRSRGLSPDELIELISANPNQTRAQIRTRSQSEIDSSNSNRGTRDIAAPSTRRSLNPCSGLSLLADDVCELAKIAPSERKSMRKETESRADAFAAAKRESGGYFGEMIEITPLYTAPAKPARGNIGYSELRGARNPDGTPVYSREYWFRNADNQIVVIQEHSLGHPGLTNGELQHFNVRHIPDNARNNPDAIRDALDSGSPPPSVPAVGHYDFGTAN